MSAFELLSPVFAMILLTFALMFWMGSLRVRATRGRQVRVKDIALGQSAWPPEIVKIERAFHNQLELPVLFYALVLYLFVTSQVDAAYIYAGWTFIAFRTLHSAVHCTFNHIMLRFYLYLISALTLWFIAIRAAFAYVAAL